MRKWIEWRKVLAAVLTAAVVVNSGAPVVYGAEFTDGESGTDVEVEAVFEAGEEAGDAEAASETVFLDSEEEVAAAEFTDEADVPVVLADMQEQFENLEVGETYWFDLSAYSGNIGSEDTVWSGTSEITGKVDTSLQWVPFTYVGTVDAYSYEDDGENNEYSQKDEENGKESTPRSLFVAQYPVKEDISWDELNGKGLIYGTTLGNYPSEGEIYNLRVFSAGYGNNDIYDGYGAYPENNEWDSIVTKGVSLERELLPNLLMRPWGQDIVSGMDETNEWRANREAHDARAWDYDLSSTHNNSNGWRPVLEILDMGSEVNKDDYVTVTLDLNGGFLQFADEQTVTAGDEGKLKQAVVIDETGEVDYTLPGGAGSRIVNEDGRIAISWLGSDGKVYPYGAPVDISGSTTFTAYWSDEPRRTIKAPSVASVGAGVITLNEVVLPEIQDGRVYYAVSKEEVGSDYDKLDWQTTRVFTELEKGAKYYCYAKVSATQNYVEAVSEPTEAVTEAFETLEVGKTYWFDLSEFKEGGTPYKFAGKADTSLQWVPFTYAGTVDAYSYVSDEENNEYRQNGEGNGKESTPRSLFVAQYLVKNFIRWDELNGTGAEDNSLIYGRNYEQGSIPYKLRVLSGGHDGDRYGGRPLNNEWDSILNKSVTYISDCDIKSSWTQDIKIDNTNHRAVRGGTSKRYWYREHSSSSGYGVVGWRPALEVLNTGSDNYATVTLDLSGGSLGEAESVCSDSVQVPMKSGDSYTLPKLSGADGEGQTVKAPADSGAVEVLWKGSDGNEYAPGTTVTVSADMSFTAVWRKEITPTVTVNDGVPIYFGDTIIPTVTGIPDDYNGTVQYLYKVKDADDSTYSAAAPTQGGNYTVKAIGAETDTYKAWEATADFAINQAVNAWTTPLSIRSWTYGRKPNAPVAAAKYGNVAFSYSSTKDGTYNVDPRKLRPGTRYVKAVVAGTNNYTGLETVVSFKVRTPMPTPTPSPVPTATPTPSPTPTPDPIPENFPEGSERNPDGSITTPDGTVVDKDGTITLPDGIVLKPDADGKTPTIDRDNTVTDTNGVIIKKDGTIILPGEDKESEKDDTIVEKGEGSRPVYNPEEESVTIREGNKVTLPNGDELHPSEGSETEIDGTTTEPDGTVYKPDGTVIDPDGTIHQPDGTVIDPDGTIHKPDGTVIDPDGTIHQPDGTVIDPDGTIHKPDGTVIDPDGTIHNPDGSIQAPDGTYLRPSTPILESAEVFATGNQVKAVLSDECRGAEGYDYVISENINCIKDKDYLSVSRNILFTETNFRYIPQGIYYVYCHAWKRGEDGKKVFSKWSNYKTVEVTAITPETPEILDVQVNGRKVTVTYTKCEDASGYDLVLGTLRRKVYGEYRPVEYGDLVKKVNGENTFTVTFKNVPKGTYYAGLHAWNRTSEDHKKVFSPWSDTWRIKVK